MDKTRSIEFQGHRWTPIIIKARASGRGGPYRRKEAEKHVEIVIEKIKALVGENSVLMGIPKAKDNNGSGTDGKAKQIMDDEFDRFLKELDIADEENVDTDDVKSDCSSEDDAKEGSCKKVGWGNAIMQKWRLCWKSSLRWL